MNNIYDDEDDVIIIVKPEIDVDQENVPSKFAAKTNDVIVLESDTEEEENNETTSKYGGSFSDEESEKDDEGTSYGNNEDDEMSDDDDVVINVKPEIEDVKTVAANNKFRLAKNADEIIVLESDSEESNDSETSQIYHEDKENDDGFNDESLDDDVIVRIKPEIADNDSDVEVEEGSHETSENPVTVNDKKEPVDFPFFQFLKFIKDLNLHNKGKLLKLKGKPDIAKIAATIPELGKHRDFYMSPDFNKNFNALYIAAARRKSIHVDDVTSIINRHLNDGRTVEDFPEFPKAPSHPINMYISEKADGEKNNIYSIAKKRKSFSSGEIDTKPYFDRYLKESKEFIKKAEKYLVEERHRLKESHITHIQNLISKKQKEIEKAEPDSEAGPSCKKRKVKTAFEYYKDANPNLYSEYDAERRDSKLLKKFNRLEDNLKQIYENIAAKNG
uniref:Uncharacterized protein n=1 Tax=Panagrolaimus sp. ES5 TaxID=591445 RepID=A0AC34FKT5_9BILA